MKSINEPVKAGYIFVATESSLPYAIRCYHMGARGYFAKIDPTDINGYAPVPVAEYISAENATLPPLDERDLLVLKQLLEDAINKNIADAQAKSTTDKQRGELAIWLKVLAHVRAKFND